MSQPISKYPGTVPRADLLNHDNAPTAGPVGYIASGTDFDQNMKVYFYDFKNNVLIMDPSPNPELTATHPAETYQVQGKVHLDAGMYQLVLQNPGLTPRPQPAWIFVEGVKVKKTPVKKASKAKRGKAKVKKSKAKKSAVKKAPAKR